MPTRRPFATALAPLGLTGLLAVVGGCSHAAVVSGPEEPNGPLKCQSVSSKDVAVSPPTVVVQNGVMTISGTVHRQVGATGPLDGRVDIDLIGADGLPLDKSLHASLIPNTVPENPSVPARYSPTPFGYVPPAGSVVRARYVDRQTAILENLKDGILDVNGNGGHTGEGVRQSAENGSMPTNPTSGGGGS